MTQQKPLVVAVAGNPNAGKSTLINAIAGSRLHVGNWPCVIVGVAMRQEFGTWKWAGVGFLYQTVLAWVVALIIYQGGQLLGLGG